MSVLAMTAAQRAEVETAQRQSRNVRHWKRYQAVLLGADGMPLTVVAQTLGCSRVSVSNWTRAWREAGVAANRCAPDLDHLAQQAADWLTTLSPYDRLRCSGLLGTKFRWLST